MFGISLQRFSFVFIWFGEINEPRTLDFQNENNNEFHCAFYPSSYIKCMNCLIKNIKSDS